VTNPNRDEPIVVPIPASLPLPPVDPDVLVAEATPHPDLPPVNARYIWFIVLAQFGVFEHVPPLSSVRAGGVLQQQRNTGTALFEIHAMADAADKGQHASAEAVEAAKKRLGGAS